MAYQLPGNCSPRQVLELRQARWLARTNLEYLCRDVLGFKDVVRHVHGPIIDIEQKFLLPPPERILEFDQLIPGRNVEYTPWMDAYALPGGRRMLLLDPRGGLKTTINCVAHLVQWVINFPQLSLLFVQSNTDKAQDVLREIKYHFQYNTRFRAIFPDLVPQKHISEFGNRDEFFAPNEEDRAKLVERLTGKSRKEPTVRAASIDKGSAGNHYDVMKFSDIVEPNNVKTDNQIKEVIYNFRMMENLLVRPDGWIDVEGTRYHYTDLYGEIVDKWGQQEAYRKIWRVHVRSCYLRDYGDKAPYYTPDSLQLPFKLTKDSKFTSWWPERFTVEGLEAKKADDLYIFATQQLNDPVAGDEAGQPFPLKNMLSISPEDFAKVRVHEYTTTVDTADTVGAKSNYSVLTTCAWDTGGRCYVVEVRLGRMMPEAIIDNIIAVNEKFRPTRILVEETSFVRGLKPALDRRMHLYGKWVPITYIKRETATSKEERILNTLQPWYARQEIRFLTDLAHKDHIMRELSRFPASSNDFLDTLADQFQGRTWMGRLGARPGASGPVLTKDERQQRNAQWWLTKQLQIQDPFDEINGYAVPVPGAARNPNHTGGL